MDDSSVSPTEMSHSEMSNVASESESPRSDTPNDGKRSIRDSAFAVILLATAIAAGYAALYPAALRAKTVATATRPPLMLASVGDPSWHDVNEVAPASTHPSPFPETPRVDVKPRQPWPGSVTGRVLGPDRQPVAGASLVLDGKEIRTDATGTFTLTTSSDRPLLVKLPGYAKVKVEPTRAAVDVKLRRQVVKAAYLTYYGVADRKIRGRVLDLIDRTELNAVVIDVKGDRGWILYRTEVPLAVAAGAQGPVTCKDFDGLLAELQGARASTRSRASSTSRTTCSPTHRPELAIIDTRTGKPWIDRENLAWVDPFRTEVWDYNIAIAREAVRKGFDEVQFDYVRFPTDGKLAAARYSKPNTKETRLPAIAGFLERARRELGPTGAFVGADVFGYTAFNENDTDIGQRIEELAPHLDYLCPMVYPSGYHVGIPGYRNPVAEPLPDRARERAADPQALDRPAGRRCARGCRTSGTTRSTSGSSACRRSAAQIKGSDDAGGLGFMLWNPENDYTGAALRPKGTLAAK